jgi:hypothetical protein
VCRTAAEHYGALRRESAQRRWSLTGLLAGVMGLVLNVVLYWPLAVLAAVVTAGALTLWDKDHGAIASWWRDDHRPYRLAAHAARLERRGWGVLPAPATTHDGTPLADYLLIGPGGIFVVDHQMWWPPESVTTDQVTGLLMVGGKPVARRVGSVKGAAAAVGHALAQWLPDEAVVRPVLTIDAPWLHRERQVVSVTVLPIADLTGFLRDRDPVLYPTGITTLTEQARLLFTGKMHVE